MTRGDSKTGGGAARQGMERETGHWTAEQRQEEESTHAKTSFPTMAPVLVVEGTYDLVVGVGDGEAVEEVRRARRHRSYQLARQGEGVWSGAETANSTDAGSLAVTEEAEPDCLPGSLRWRRREQWHLTVGTSGGQPTTELEVRAARSVSVRAAEVGCRRQRSRATGSWVEELSARARVSFSCCPSASAGYSCTPWRISARDRMCLCVYCCL